MDSTPSSSSQDTTYMEMYNIRAYSGFFYKEKRRIWEEKNRIMCLFIVDLICVFLPYYNVGGGLPFHPQFIQRLFVDKNDLVSIANNCMDLYHSLFYSKVITECPKIYRKFVLHLLKYRCCKLKQMQYRFAVNFWTLSM